MPLAYGSNAINVSVTENNVPYPYTITVTRPQPIGARTSIVPSPVAPGGKVTVTLEFDPKTYGAFALVIETLPAGFSWVFIADADLPDNVSMQLDPPGSQTLHITILGNLNTITYDILVDPATTPGIYNLAGIIRDDDLDDHMLVGESQITVAIPPGVTVSPTDLTVDEGGSGTYTVVLNTLPTGDVMVAITDPADNTDVTANPASLTFSTSNWNTAQTVTVSAAEDGDPLEDTATVTHTVSGGDYGAITAQDVAVTVTDNDTPGVTVAPTSLTVGEGDMGTYTV